MCEGATGATAKKRFGRRSRGGRAPESWPARLPKASAVAGSIHAGDVKDFITSKDRGRIAPEDSTYVPELLGLGQRLVAVLIDELLADVITHSGQGCAIATVAIVVHAHGVREPFSRVIDVDVFRSHSVEIVDVQGSPKVLCLIIIDLLTRIVPPTAGMKETKVEIGPTNTILRVWHVGDGPGELDVNGCVRDRINAHDGGF